MTTTMIVGATLGAYLATMVAIGLIAEWSLARRDRRRMRRWLVVLGSLAIVCGLAMIMPLATILTNG